jgi:RimJ/RimL family protein N-acetyltransferase
MTGIPTSPLGPTLETERLILRPPIEADLDAWADFMADEEAMRHIGGVQQRSVAWRSMATFTGAWALRGFSMFSVIEKASGRWIGRLGPWQPEGWPGTEVGWGLARSSWRKGYATEGAIATIDWAFDKLGWTDVIHTIAPANDSSAAVAKRLGSGNRGPGKLPAPFEHLPIDVWGQTREQWRARLR